MLSQSDLNEQQKLKYPRCDTIEQKLQQGLDYKQQGNQFFKHKDYQKALSSYYKVLLYINGICDTNQYSDLFQKSKQVDIDTKSQIFNLQIQVHNNMSQIYIYQQKWAKSISSLNKAIEICNNNKIEIQLKTYYRRCVSYLGLKDYEKCEQDLQMMSTMGGSDEVTRLRKQVDQQSKAEDRKNQKVYQNMFK